MEMCILCKVCILLFMYIVHFSYLVACTWHRVLYLRISLSVHLCTCVIVKRFDLNIAIVIDSIISSLPCQNLTCVHESTMTHKNVIFFKFKYLMCILMSINKGVCYVGVGDKID